MGATVLHMSFIFNEDPGVSPPRTRKTGMKTYMPRPGYRLQPVWGLQALLRVSKPPPRSTGLRSIRTSAPYGRPYVKPNPKPYRPGGARSTGPNPNGTG